MSFWPRGWVPRRSSSCPEREGGLPPLPQQQYNFWRGGVPPLGAAAWTGNLHMQMVHVIVLYKRRMTRTPKGSSTIVSHKFMPQQLPRWRRGGLPPPAAAVPCSWRWWGGYPPPQQQLQSLFGWGGATRTLRRSSCGGVPPETLRDIILNIYIYKASNWAERGRSPTAEATPYTVTSTTSAERASAYSSAFEDSFAEI